MIWLTAAFMLVHLKKKINQNFWVDFHSGESSFKSSLSAAAQHEM